MSELFLDIFKKYPKLFLILSLLVLFQIFINTLSIISIAPIVEFFTKSDDVNYKNSFILKYYFLIFDNNNLNLFSLISTFGVLMLFVGIFSVLIRFVILKIQYTILTFLQVDTLQNFYESSYEFFNINSYGILLNSFSKEIQKIGVAFSQFSLLFANIVQLTVLLLIPFLISVNLTIYFILISIIIVTPIFLIRNFIYLLGKKNVETSNKSINILQETISSSKLVYSFNNQSKVVDNYYSAFKKHADVSTILQTLTSSIYILLVPFGLIAALLVLYIGYINNYPLTDLAIIIFTFSRIVPILAQIFQSKATIEGVTAAFDQINNLNKIAERLKEKKDNREVADFKNKIEFKSVSFDYNNKKIILKNLSLIFNKNKTTILIGKSGSGKTTIVDLLLGLYKPKYGEIFFDEFSFNKINLKSIRNLIGYVPQEPFLYNTSIKNNLLWSNPKISEKNISNALELANADEFIKNLPDKMDTIVGDRGNKLSGGQKQRLALARALLSNPKILVLDEATSHLDVESERLITKSISKLKNIMTIIIITHKLNINLDADYVYVIDQGSVSEQGFFKDLKNIENSYVNTLLKASK